MADTEASDDLRSTEVATILSCSPRTVQRIPRAKLPYRESPGGWRLYNRVDVEQYATQLRGEGR